MVAFWPSGINRSLSLDRNSSADESLTAPTLVHVLPLSVEYSQEPVLPVRPLDAMLQCDALAEFLRKALADQGSTYGEAANAYGTFIEKLDPKMSMALRAAGLRGADALRAKKLEAVAAAAKLGQPPAVMAACEKAYAT